MFTTKETTICEKSIESFLSEIDYILESEELTEEEALKILRAVSEKAGWNIDSILSETIQEIENGNVRNWYRRFLISEKYGILMKPRGGTTYGITHASDECVLVYSPHIPSTIMLTPQGKIKIPEGEVYLNDLLNFHGFSARWGDKCGLYTSKGTPLFPCIFEYVENSPFFNFAKLRYKGYEYNYYQLEAKSAPKNLDRNKIAFTCEDSIYQLFCNGFANDGEIHRGAITYHTNNVDETYNNLPKEEIIRMIEENVADLKKELGKYHHIFECDEAIEN